MSVSIPTAYINGFGFGYPVIYIVRLSPAGGDVMYLVSYSNDPMTLTYGGSPVAAAQIFTSLLAAEVNGSPVQGIGEIDFNFPLIDGGGLAGRNEVTVQLLNQQFLSDTFLQYDIENTDIEIWQGYFDTISLGVAIDTDCLLLFKGVIYDWDTWDHNLISLKCYDNQHLVDKKIPPRMITSGNFPNAPDGLINKPIPILIGDFESENSSTYGGGSRNSYEIGIFNLAPTVIVDATEDGEKIYLSSEAWDNPGDALYWQDGDSPWIARIDSAAVSYVDDGSVYFIQAAPDTYADVYVRPIMPLTDNTAIDVRNVTDTDPDNSLDVGTGLYSLVLGMNDFTEPGQFIGSSDTVRGWGDRRIGFSK